MNNKNYLKHIIISYLILIALQILVIVGINFAISNNVRTQIDTLNNQYLRQFSSVMENTFEEVESLQSVMLSSSYHSRFNSIEDGDDYYLMYELRQYLNELFLINHSQEFEILDMFIYYESSNRIVSGTNGALEAQYYIDLFFDEDSSDILNEFKTEGWGQSVFNVHIDSNEYLAVSLPYFNQIRGSNNKSSAVVILSSDLIVNLNELLKVYNNSVTTVFDEDKTVLTSSHSGIDMDGYDIADNYEDEFNGIEYNVNVHWDDDIGCYYLTAVPSSVYWNGVSSVNFISIAGGIFFVVISLAFALRLAFYSYSPVKTAIAKIKLNDKRGIEEKTNSNEFEYIVNLLNNISDESDKRESEARYAFIGSLIDGSISPDDDEIKKYGFEQSSGNYIVVCFKVEEYSHDIFGEKNNEESFKLLSLVHKNILEEISSTYGTAYLFPKSVEEFVLILSLNSEFVENRFEYIEGICNTFKTTVKTNFELINSVAVGGLVDSLGLINNSYESSKFAMRQQFILGKDKLVFFEKIDHSQDNYPIESAKFKVMFSSYITSAQESATQTVEKISSYTESKNVSNLYIDRFIYGVVNALENIIKDLGGYENSSSEIYKLTTAQTVDEFKVELISILERMREAYIIRQESNKLAIKINNYIDENYPNTELSSEFIAEEFALSKAYVSRMFKSAYNKTISEHISDVRLENAKLLLEKGNMTVVEISSKVGFLSSNTFIRVFKKHEDITPGEYAKMSKKY